MRNIIYKLTACSALIVLTLSSCKDSFLEEDPNGYISSGQIKENAEWNPNIMLGQALGTYSTTFAWKTGGTTNHDDFGQKSIDITTDLMSGDLAMSGETYGWFSDAARLQCNTTTKNRAYQVYQGIFCFTLSKSAAYYMGNGGNLIFILNSGSYCNSSGPGADSHTFI